MLNGNCWLNPFGIPSLALSFDCSLYMMYSLTVPLCVCVVCEL